MSQEDFLKRWSRLKQESANRLPEQAPPAELPALDSLNFESDFKAFMHSKVEESVKRAALKKLFSDPRFNVMDGLDTYIDDYTKAEPITEELLARLDHARQTLFGTKEEEKKAVAESAPEQVLPEDQKSDGNPGQDA